MEAEFVRIGNNAIALLSSHRADEALPLFLQASALANVNGDKQSETVWLANAGVAALQKKDFTVALTHFTAALELSRSITDRETEVRLQRSIADCLIALGRAGECIEVLATALDAAKVGGLKRECSLIAGYMGELFRQAGGPSKALRYLRAAADSATEIGDSSLAAKWIRQIGHIHSECHDPAQAAKAYQEALDLAQIVADVELTAELRGLLHSATTEADRHTQQLETLSSLDDPGRVVDVLQTRLSMLPHLAARYEGVESEQSRLAQTIKACIALNDNWHALAAIEESKGLVGRELLARRRAAFAGLNNLAIVAYSITAEKLKEIIANLADVCLISFYYTDEYDCFAFVAYVKDNVPVIERITLAVRGAGTNLHAALLDLSATLKENPFADITAIVYNCLNDFGEAILPRVLAVPGIKKILLSPYKLLYMLPLHALLWLDGQIPKFLWQVGPITCASSLWAHAYRGKFHPPSADRRSLLALLDREGLGDGVGIEGDFYRLVSREPANVLIVDGGNTMPEEMGLYSVIMFSCHAHSDPTSWLKSFISFGGRRYTAETILAEWDLRDTHVAVLLTCPPKSLPVIIWKAP